MNVRPCPSRIRHIRTFGSNRKSAQQPAFRDPVIYINGGPGEPLTAYAVYQTRKPYAAQRDLILVDHRGIGRSEPDLCRDSTAGFWRGTGSLDRG